MDPTLIIFLITTAEQLTQKAIQMKQESQLADEQLLQHASDTDAATLAAVQSWIAKVKAGQVAPEAPAGDIAGAGV